MRSYLKVLQKSCETEIPQERGSLKELGHILDRPRAIDCIPSAPCTFQQQAPPDRQENSQPQECRWSREGRGFSKHGITV